MAQSNLFASLIRPLPGPLDLAERMDARDAQALQMRAGEANLAAMQRKQRLEDEALGREAQDRNAFAELVRSSGGDQQRLMQGLMGSGSMPLVAKGQGMQKAALDAQKTQADIAKDTATATKTRFETLDAKKKSAIQDIALLSDRSQAEAELSDQVRQGVLTMQQAQGLMQSIPQEPERFAQWKHELILRLATPESQMQAQTTRAGQQLTAQTSKENAAMADARIRSEGAANRAVQMRGQNLTDARTRESTAATMSKPFEVTGPDGLPLLVQQDKKGNIVPVQGFGPKSGSAKPLNDTQAKALLFGTRMQESDKVLTTLSAQGDDLPSLTKRAAEGVPLVGGALGMAANMVATPGQQQVEQAQRDFINAVLRRESGAVIADSEFANARKQYFVEPGDSKAVKQQKARNRQLAIDGLLAEVPEGRRASITPKAADEPDSARVVDFSTLK